MPQDNMADVLLAGMQARADRHNQRLSPEERGRQYNQDFDHYLVGNEMAGPQYPLWQRLGAIAPMVGHEVARPVIAKSKLVTDALNKVFGTPDEPVWIAEGAGAGGAAQEKAPGFAGAARNLAMLYRGATEGEPPVDTARIGRGTVAPPSPKVEQGGILDMLRRILSSRGQ